MDESLILFVFYGITATLGIFIRRYMQATFWVNVIAAIVLLLIVWGIPFQPIMRILIWGSGYGLMRWLVFTPNYSLRQLLRYLLVYYCFLLIMIVIWALLSKDIRIWMGIGIPAGLADGLVWHRLLQGSDFRRGVV